MHLQWSVGQFAEFFARSTASISQNRGSIRNSISLNCTAWKFFRSRRKRIGGKGLPLFVNLPFSPKQAIPAASNKNTDSDHWGEFSPMALLGCVNFTTVLHALWFLVPLRLEALSGGLPPRGPSLIGKPRLIDSERCTLPTLLTQDVTSRSSGN
jgi:hypothetical protein